MMLMLMMPTTMLMMIQVKFGKAGKPTVSARKQELPPGVQVACPHSRGIGPGIFNCHDDDDDDDSNNEDEGDNNLEKVMVEKADLADGLLLELEEERSRSHNR